MSTEPNRQPGGIPTGGQFAKKTQSDDVVSLAVAPEPEKTLGDALGEQHRAIMERFEAHSQNEWAEAARAKYPDAAYAYVAVTSDRDGTFTAGMGLYDAAGEEIDVDENDAVGFEDRFDVSWDMEQHATPESRAIFTRNSGVFSLDSVKAQWEKLSADKGPLADPFAHLTGMEKAKAQAEYAQKASVEAAETYVSHLTSEILAAQPNAVRLNVTRAVDVEYGHIYTLENVIDANGNVLDVDLGALQDEDFHDIHFDRHTDYDEDDDQLYVDLVPAT